MKSPFPVTAKTPQQQIAELRHQLRFARSSQERSAITAQINSWRPAAQPVAS